MTTPRADVILVDAPSVEGAVIAATGADLDTVTTDAQHAVTEISRLLATIE